MLQHLFIYYLLYHLLSGCLRVVKLRNICYFGKSLGRGGRLREVVATGGLTVVVNYTL